MIAEDIHLHRALPALQRLYNYFVLRQHSGIVWEFLLRIYRRFEHWYLKRGNIVISYRLDGKSVTLPWSHSLPGILLRYPSYSFNTARIGSHVLRRYPSMTFLDVGANVGDTVIIQRSMGRYPILCIEGDPFFFELLIKNTAQEEDVHCVRTFVGEAEETIQGHMQMTGTTGNVSQEEGAGTLVLRTIDGILKEYPAFNSVRMLKIDTDGFDFKILRGANELLERAKPVLFFEYDPYFLAQQQEDDAAMFRQLRRQGYEHMLVYDNFGELMRTMDVADTSGLEELHSYFSGRNGSAYCDLCLFHADDAPLFHDIRTSEISRARTQSKS
jgi:FkbM family methyltransferase